MSDRLGRVEHSRCAEWSGTTLVWVPEGWTDEDFEVAVEKARKAYQDFVYKWSEQEKKNAPPMVWGKPTIEGFDDTDTVADVRQEWERKRAARKEYEVMEREAYRTFSEYLAKEGLIPLWEREPDVKATIDWGHQHGTHIAYGEAPHDLSGPLEREKI